MGQHFERSQADPRPPWVGSIRAGRDGATPRPTHRPNAPEPSDERFGPIYPLALSGTVPKTIEAALRQRDTVRYGQVDKDRPEWKTRKATSGMDEAKRHNKRTDVLNPPRQRTPAPTWTTPSRGRRPIEERTNDCTGYPIGPTPTPPTRRHGPTA